MLVTRRKRLFRLFAKRQCFRDERRPASPTKNSSHDSAPRRISARPFTHGCPRAATSMDIQATIGLPCHMAAFSTA
eukprot:78526-Chlamydomonas_euryale.AAC.2